MTTDASLFCVCFFNACAHGWAHTNLDSIVWWLNLMQNTCSAVTDIYCLREILSASGANELDLQHYREQLLHRVNHSAICHRFTMSSHTVTKTHTHLLAAQSQFVGNPWEKVITTEYAPSLLFPLPLFLFPLMSHNSLFPQTTKGRHFAFLLQYDFTDTGFLKAVKKIFGKRTSAMLLFSGKPPLKQLTVWAVFTSKEKELYFVFFVLFKHICRLLLLAQ